jgi:hypothetical protein
MTIDVPGILVGTTLLRAVPPEDLKVVAAASRTYPPGFRPWPRP